jgi:hypothetical protein
MPSQTFYRLSEVPTEGGNFGFVDALLASSKVQNFKRELKSILEDPQEVADQINQFLGPQISTWAEFMSILRILFSEEGRIMIRRVFMARWERAIPGLQS